MSPSKVFLSLDSRAFSIPAAFWAFLLIFGGGSSGTGPGRFPDTLIFRMPLRPSLPKEVPTPPDILQNVF
ncbi:MAG: hypothetical protein ABGY29_13020 [bacterium]